MAATRKRKVFPAGYRLTSADHLASVAFSSFSSLHCTSPPACSRGEIKVGVKAEPRQSRIFRSCLCVDANGRTAAAAVVVVVVGTGKRDCVRERLRSGRVRAAREYAHAGKAALSSHRGEQGREGEGELAAAFRRRGEGMDLGKNWLPGNLLDCA